MALILNIETATEACSVAFSRDGYLSALKESQSERSHAMELTVLIETIIHTQSIKIQDLDAVAVSMGPGSYTGLRIGVSVAKGIAYSIGKPLIAVNTLQAMTYGIITKHKEIDYNAWFCPMIDARRMEVYTAFFDYSLNAMREIKADIIDSNSYLEILNAHKVIFFGDGAAKCKETIQHPNAIFIDDFRNSAQDMIQLSDRAFYENKFVDTAYFEPFYLKDFVAKIAKNKVLL
jgi:tRNA threonylcarbamoyladenosine biosynthesis protein TsaB